MATEAIQTPIDPVNPAITQTEEVGSLDDFAAKYSKERPTVSDEDDAPRRDARNRSPRRADDHETISALTKRLRDAEAQMGVNTAREDGESDRAYNLRLRAEAAEAAAKIRTERREEPKPVQVQQPIEPPSAFSEKEPTIEQFADQGDPYSAWQRELGRYDRRKEAFDAKQATATASVEERRTQALAAREAVYRDFGTKAIEFAKTTPDYQSVVEAAKDRCFAPPLLETALVGDRDNGPRYLYLLARPENQQIFDEMFLFADGKIVNAHTVASMQRLLVDRFKSRMPAGTGSAHTPQTVDIPPPPPNPVRTGRMRSSSSEPPDTEHMSLDDFAQATSSKRGRR